MPIIRSKNHRPRRRRTTVAPGLATIAVALAVTAACNSATGSDSDSTAAAGPDPDTSTATSCQVGTTSDLTGAAWNKTSTLGGTDQPAAAIVLDHAYDLPDEYGDRVAAIESSPGSAWVSGSFTGYPAEGVVQYPDGRVGVIVQPDEADSSARLAVLNPDGTLDSEFDAGAARLAPELVSGTTAVSTGYHRIEADGIEIPASASGDESHQVYAISASSNTDGQVWVLLRGADQLYSGTLYAGDSEASHPLGQAFDTSGCQ